MPALDELFEKHGKLAEFSADEKNRLLKQKKDEEKHFEFCNRVREAENRQADILREVADALQRLSEESNGFAALLKKLAGKETGIYCITLWKMKCGKHQLISGGGGDDLHHPCPDGGYFYDYMSNPVSIKEVATEYCLYIFIENGSHGVDDYYKIKAGFIGGKSGRPYLFEPSFSKPGNDSYTPLNVRESALRVINQLQTPESALKFFENNLSHLIKVNKKQKK